MDLISMGLSMEEWGHDSRDDRKITGKSVLYDMNLSPIKVLLVDDELDVILALKSFLENEGYTVSAVDNAVEALEMIPTFSPHLVFLDMMMPGMNGLEALERIRSEYPDIITFILTAHECTRDAVQAIKTGANDYFRKPYHLEEIKLSILKALEGKQLREEVVQLRKTLAERFDFSSIITADPKIYSIFDALRKIAPSHLNILITGENGTGKELLAKAIHYNSKRKEGPFTPVDCAAIPDTLFESEMFGFVRGAFTGADHPKQGVFQMANGGTLFLDELGNLKPEFQSKLLRAIQEHKILPLGGKEFIDLDLRLISATNTDLEAAKAKGTFREDLYYRIRGYHIHLPPLRERANDIMLLANHFLNEQAEKEGAIRQEISSEAMDILMDYPWPGNIRELKSVIQGASVLAEERIFPDHLDLPVISKQYTKKGVRISLYIPNGCTLKMMHKRVLAQAERFYIEKVFMDSDYRKKEASARLDISQKELIKKIEEYHIETRMDSDETAPEWIKEVLKPGTTFKELNEKIGYDVERLLIMKALCEAKGNKAQTARTLSIDYKTLHSKMSEYKISKDGINETEFPEYMHAILQDNPCCSFKELLNHTRQKMETLLILMNLRHTNWDKAKAARIMKIDYKTLYNKMEKYKLMG